MSEAAVKNTNTNNNNNTAKKDKPKQVRETNILAGKALGEAIRTSLGPKGMDKMIVAANKNITISNDGATILKEMQLVHPVAKMLVEVSSAQDIEAGDGTTSVVVIACSLLDEAWKLLNRGIHPTKISEGFQKGLVSAIAVLRSMSMPVDLADNGLLLKLAKTSLSSKVVSQYSETLAPIAVDAVMCLSKIGTEKSANNTVDLRDISIIKKLGGTIEDTQLITDGVVIDRHISVASNPKNVSRLDRDVKVGLIQFCVSPPKTDMDSNVVVSDYTQMDRVLREERQYTLKMCKAIAATGVKVLLVQKSILRDAVSELAMHFFAKLNVLVIRDIERDQIERICRVVPGLKPAASLDFVTAPDSNCIATVKYVEEVTTSTGEKYVKIGSGLNNTSVSPSIVIHGSNHLVMDEAERSLHDALCVIRCLVKEPAMVVGGGALETEISCRLEELSHTLVGSEALCVKAFGQAMEVVPVTLAENAGLDAVKVMTQLKIKHASDPYYGINLYENRVQNLREDLKNAGQVSNIVHPLVVALSYLNLSCEAVRMILKIDDLVASL